MKPTYKVVFICEALGEREVWYCSSKSLANYHVNMHIRDRASGILARYRHNKYTFTVKEIFKEGGESFDGSVFSAS